MRSATRWKATSAAAPDTRTSSPLYRAPRWRSRNRRAGMATLFGSGIRRREDPRLVTGRATYTDDVKLPGLTYAAILRSPYAHATIKSIDVRAARKAAGVIAVYTGADIKDKVIPVP